VIYNLQGRFEHGRITFSENEDHGKLKDQLLMFPSPKAHDDLPDALSMIAYLHETVYGTFDWDDEYEVLDEVAGY
jgi:hypothetical protein